MKTGTEIVQQYMEKEKVGLSVLARRSGLTRQACRQRFVLQKDVTVKKFLEMMACLGYAMELKKSRIYSRCTERARGDPK